MQQREESEITSCRPVGRKITPFEGKGSTWCLVFDNPKLKTILKMLPSPTSCVRHLIKVHFRSGSNQLSHSTLRKLHSLTLKTFAHLSNVFGYLCSSSSFDIPFSSHGNILLLVKIVHTKHRRTRLNDTEAHP